MAFKLISTEGDQQFELRAGVPLVVGRAPNSDIPIFDPTISRRHAELTCDAGGLQVRDLGSSNGTYLNGAQIQTGKVTPGDIVTFGKVAFRLREATPVPPPTPRPDAGGSPSAGTIVRAMPFDIGQVGASLAATAGDQPKGTRIAAAIGASPAAQDRSHVRLAMLLDVSIALTKELDVDALLGKIVDMSIKIFECDRAAILLGEDRSRLVPRVARDKRGKALGEMVPQSIAGPAFEERSAILTDNAAEDTRFGGQSILIQQVRSAMCAPLVGTENKPLGVLYVDSQLTNKRFVEDDLNFLAAFSSIAAVALENSQFAERIRREEQARQNLQRFFTPELAERIAASPDAVKLGGDKRQVAVLFSDIRGFTALSETMSPGDMADLLTEYFTEMVECVFRHGGTLDKFIGDAVMAQWGAPISFPDDADRAMRAAVEMMQALDTLNARWKDEGRPTLEIGIGINFGDAFAGNIGSERRLEFTVIGDTVNTASRLCSAAGGHEILISEEFRAALKEPPPLEAMAPMELKNKRKPVPIYRVALDAPAA